MREIVTFDAYGTLIDFQLGPTTLKVLEDRLDLDSLDVDEFLDDFRVMRFQAVLEAYRPYHEVLHSSLEWPCGCTDWSTAHSDGDALVEAVPTFGPFPEVPARAAGPEVPVRDRHHLQHRRQPDRAERRATSASSSTTSSPPSRPGRLQAGPADLRARLQDHGRRPVPGHPHRPGLGVRPHPDPRPRPGAPGVDQPLRPPRQRRLPALRRAARHVGPAGAARLLTRDAQRRTGDTGREHRGRTP